MATITLSNVRKVYPGGFTAIHGVDVDVEEGELIVLVGPSGCGKSTLLRMVAGLETVSEGEIRIDGAVVNGLEPKDRDIAMVFQNYALYPHMSVFANMAYGLKNRGFPKPEIETKVREAARILELEALLERRPRQLSGGQRQRVAMGRAIVRDPKAFLFDEPLSNLDAKLRVQMRVEIKRLQRRLATTSLYVTHDQVEAMTLADRLVVMNAGVAEQIGRPVELYDRPATRFVAGFIGSPAMSFLEARIGPDERSADLGQGAILKLARERPGEAGRPVIVGVRPEHVVPAADAGAGGLALGIDLVEALGADSLIHGTLAGAPLVVRLSGHAALREGERLPVAIDPARVYLFDPDTGRALV